MTVTNDTSSVTHNGNGVTTTWPYTFHIPDADAANVGVFDTETNVLTTLAPALYEITGLNDEAGGSVEYPLPFTTDPISATERLVIWREVPFTQDLELTNQSPYFPTVLEDQLDLIVYQIQQLAEETDRAIKVTLGSNLTPDEFVEDLQQGAADAAASATAAAASEAAAAEHVGDAELWAISPENTPIPVEAGGDGATTYSALHWSAKAEAAAAGVNLPSIVAGDAGKFLRVKADETGHEHITADVVRSDIGLSEIGLFLKADPYAAAFTKTGAGTISVKAGTIIEVDGSIFTFGSATAVTMPSLTAGTDYVIWIKPDGSLEATTNFTSPPVANSRRLGGFHYAPGGNAAAYNSGGDTTSAINEFSIWDMKFRPSCPDPRGMALVAGSFWVDIYLCGVNHHTDGTSKYNVTIADGSSPPKISAAFGGNGSSAYSTLNWWEAAEVMASHGKELLDYAEFAAAAYGTTENSSGGTDPVSTILRAAYTSKWGVMLATGNLYVWGREFSYRTGANTGFGWRDVNGGRGQMFLENDTGLVAALFGGEWASAANAGSRASNWSLSPWDSYSGVGARGRSDHLNHE